MLVSFGSWMNVVLHVGIAPSTYFSHVVADTLVDVPDLLW